MKLKRLVLLNKIEEDVESRRKSETKGISDEKSNLILDAEKEMRKTMNVTENVRIRPKSANGVNGVKPWKTAPKKRPKSSCALEKQMSQNDFCPDKYHRTLQDFKVRPKQREMNVSIPPSCMCGVTCSSCLCTRQNYFSSQQKYWPALLNRCTAEQQQKRRCRSTPNILGSGIKIPSQPLSKFKRSLKLLGFEPSDFGVCGKKAPELSRRKTQWQPTLSTKLIRRTVSLDTLRETIREAWADDSLDFHHRKLLSKAAYEEWYFRKEREWQIKEEKKKMEAFRNHEKRCRDYLMKRIRAEEEFQKWALRKRKKTKENDKNSIKTLEQPFDKDRKTKEDIEKAFVRWKKNKDKEIREKNKKKNREEEKNRESERQKMERKVVAEKAFQQWKNNLYKWEKFEKEKRRKKQERFEKKRTKEADSKISFQIWKAIKDESIRQKSNEVRNAAKVERKEMLARMEERLYEAEQAFEEWLGKKSFKKETNTETRPKNIPWIPV